MAETESSSLGSLAGAPYPITRHTGYRRYTENITGSFSAFLKGGWRPKQGKDDSDDAGRRRAQGEAVQGGLMTRFGMGGAESDLHPEKAVKGLGTVIWASE